MNSNTRKVVLPVLAALLVGMMVIASSAMAVHSRPKAATPFSAPMVIAFKDCGGAAGAPTSTHGGGVGIIAPSCELHNFTTANAATGGQTSASITVGTPTSTLAPAPAESTSKFLICVPSAAAPNCGGIPPNQAGPGDVELEASLNDVRCINGIPTLPCSAAGSNGPQSTRDYTGEVQGTATIRITDENNTAGPGGSTHATVVDIPFPVNAACAENAAQVGSPLHHIGGTCTANTSANATVPNAVVPGKRGNVEIGQLKVVDGGADGLIASSPNTDFMKQGIFIE